MRSRESVRKNISTDMQVSQQGTWAWQPVQMGGGCRSFPVRRLAGNLNLQAILPLISAQCRQRLDRGCCVACVVLVWTMGLRYYHFRGLIILISLCLSLLSFQRLQRGRLDHPGKDLFRDEDELRERTRCSGPARILGPALLAGGRRPGEV